MLVQRLGNNADNAEYIDGLIRELKKHKGCCDEIWLATDYGYPSVKSAREKAKALKKTADVLRENGFKVSLQVSNTFGHGLYISSKDCSGLVYDGSPVKKMTDVSGATCDYCFCWNDEFFKKYIIDIISEYALIEPDTLWFDDDLRFFSHPPYIDLGCFCDDCISKFNKKYDLSVTRKDLYDSVFTTENPELRNKYFGFMKEGVGKFVYEICSAFHAKSNKTAFGLQYGDFKSELVFGSEFIFKEMKRASGINPKARPGGGVYNDYNPLDLLEKCLRVCELNAGLPPYVSEITPEIENLPDVVYGKSGAGTCLETALYLANGCSGATYAMVMAQYEPFSYHGTIFEEFSKQRGYFDTLIGLNENTRQSGLNYVYCDNAWKKDISKGQYGGINNFHVNTVNDAINFLRNGIPVAFGNKKSEGVYLLTFNNVSDLSDEKIRFLLSKRVICDAQSFEFINKKYKKFKCSFDALESRQSNKMLLRFTDHTVNGDFSGKLFPKSFYSDKLYYLSDGDRSVYEPVSCYTSFAKDAAIVCNSAEYPYGVCDAVVESEDGIKWCVIGSGLMNPAISYERRNQLINCANYLQADSVKTVITSKYQIMSMPRENSQGQIVSVSLLNMTVGDSCPIELKVQNLADGAVYFYAQYHKKIEIPREDAGNGIVRLRLPSIKAWSVGTVFVG